jgi:ribosomal protein S18 acetylase RimI-like enzyme
MNKKIMVILVLLASLNAYAMERGAASACTVFTPAIFEILPFNDQRDTQEFLDLANANREVLLLPDGRSLDDILFYKSITPEDIKTHDSLIIKVLRAPATRKTELKGFAAYTMVDATTMRGCLLAVKKDAQRKHYAQYLMRHGIDDALEKNATKLWAPVSKFNLATQILYRKVAALYPNLKLDVKEATEVLKDDSERVGNELVFELELIKK